MVANKGRDSGQRHYSFILAEQASTARNATKTQVHQLEDWRAHDDAALTVSAQIYSFLLCLLVWLQQLYALGSCHSERDLAGSAASLMQQTLRVLVVHDVDVAAATRLASWVLCSSLKTAYDLCCVLGPLTHHEDGLHLTAELRAADEGYITTTIAVLEQIVCRVVYLPAPDDLSSDDVHLTPSSRSIAKRALQLLPGLIAVDNTQLDSQLVLTLSCADIAAPASAAEQVGAAAVVVQITANLSSDIHLQDNHTKDGSSSSAGVRRRAVSLRQTDSFHDITLQCNAAASAEDSVKQQTPLWTVLSITVQSIRPAGDTGDDVIDTVD
jgi:hypothetical protein